MKALVLLVGEDEEWSPEVLLKDRLRNREVPDGFSAELDGEWLLVIGSDSVLADYELEDLCELRKVMGEQLRPYLVSWRGEGLLFKFLSAIPHGVPAFVDDDNGTILPVSEFLSARIKERGQFGGVPEL